MGSALYTIATVVMFGTIYFAGLFAFAQVWASRQVRKMDPNSYRYRASSHMPLGVSELEYDWHRIKRDRREILKESLWLATVWPVWTPLWLVIAVVRWIVKRLIRAGRRLVMDPLTRSLDVQVGPSPVELKIENDHLKAERDRQRKELKRLEKIEAERDDIAEALVQEERRRETSTA